MSEGTERPVGWTAVRECGGIPWITGEELCRLGDKVPPAPEPSGVEVRRFDALTFVTENREPALRVVIRWRQRGKKRWRKNALIVVSPDLRRPERVNGLKNLMDRVLWDDVRRMLMG